MNTQLSNNHIAELVEARKVIPFRWMNRVSKTEPCFIIWWHDPAVKTTDILTGKFKGDYGGHYTFVSQKNKFFFDSQGKPLEWYNKKYGTMLPKKWKSNKYQFQLPQNDTCGRWVGLFYILNKDLGYGMKKIQKYIIGLYKRGVWPNYDEMIINMSKKELGF